VGSEVFLTNLNRLDQHKEKRDGWSHLDSEYKAMQIELSGFPLFRNPVDGLIYGAL
jgi:hypothetical protein